MADLANQDRKHVPANIMARHWRAISTLTMWPLFDRPPKVFWVIFRKFIRDVYVYSRIFCYSKRGKANQRIELMEPLLAWLYVKQNISHHSFRNQHYLFHKDSNNRCWRYKPSANINAHVRVNECDAPSNAHPVSARIENKEMWTNQNYQFLPFPEKPAESSIRRIKKHPC